jgi:hypothetical protein
MSLECTLSLCHPRMYTRDKLDRTLSREGTGSCRMPLTCTLFHSRLDGSRHHTIYTFHQSLRIIILRRCLLCTPSNHPLGRNTSHRSSTCPQCRVLGYLRMSPTHTLSPRHQHMSKAHMEYKHLLARHKS